VVWRTAPHTFHIEVWRSFIPYLEGQLRDVARGIVFDLLAVQ
jgi:sarcosine oxidase gamma subunit